MLLSKLSNFDTLPLSPAVQTYCTAVYAHFLQILQNKYMLTEVSIISINLNLRWNSVRSNLIHLCLVSAWLNLTLAYSLIPLLYP